MSVTLDEFDAFVRALDAHDWYYPFADSHAVWSAGRASAGRLQAQALDRPALQAAFHAYHTHVHRRAAIDIDRTLQALRDEIANAAALAAHEARQAIESLGVEPVWVDPVRVDLKAA